MDKKEQKPIENYELVEAIAMMQDENSAENVNRMIDCVMKAQFITPGNVSKPVPVAKTNGDGTGTVMQQQTQIQFQLIENQDKQKFFPAFTDKAEKDKWAQAEGKHDVIMTFDSFVQVLSAPDCNVSGFVINPFGRSVAFPKEMVMSLKKQKDAMEANGGLQKRQIAEDENIQISDPEPEEYPIDMMASIINYLRERDDVKAAYLRMFRREEQEKPSYLIVVDFTGNKMTEIFKGINTFANPHLNGFELSMMPYSMPFAQKAVEGVEPFFEKE